MLWVWVTDGNLMCEECQICLTLNWIYRNGLQLWFCPGSMCESYSCVRMDPLLSACMNIWQLSKFAQSIAIMSVSWAHVWELLTCENGPLLSVRYTFLLLDGASFDMKCHCACASGWKTKIAETNLLAFYCLTISWTEYFLMIRPFIISNSFYCWSETSEMECHNRQVKFSIGNVKDFVQNSFRGFSALHGLMQYSLPQKWDWVWHKKWNAQQDFASSLKWN